MFMGIVKLSREESNGLGKVSDGFGKVSYGLRNVSDGIGKVSAGVSWFNTLLAANSMQCKTLPSTGTMGSGTTGNIPEAKTM